MGFFEYVFGIKNPRGLSKEDWKTIIGVGAQIYIGDAMNLHGVPAPYNTQIGIGLTGLDGLATGLLAMKTINPYLKKRKQAMEWLETQTGPARRDPLVLDLNRDGKVDLKNATYFDLNANGFHEFTRWIDKTDAFLVLDKNFNGKADNGSELFGDVMTLPDGSLALTGFDALRAYDSNGDGKIDASDEIYASLKVLTGEGKMSSLADAGIKSLNVASEAVNESTPPALSQSDLAKLTWDERVLALKDQAREADRALWKSGGSIRAKGTFEWQDGSTGTVAEALPCIEGEQEFLRKLDDTRNDVWFCGVAA